MVILEAKDLTKSFGGLMAVADVSVKVNSGELVGLIGPNGAGKTTLFNMLSGYYKPTSGEVYFKGKDISKLKVFETSYLGIARTFQIVKPFGKMSVLDNVMVGAFAQTDNKKIAKEKALEVLDFVGLLGAKDNLAESMTLGGKKRIELARALATEPELLLLDEVVAGLNPSEVNGVIEIIRRICKEKKITIVMVEHVMQAIMALSDRIIVMNSGRKIAEGIPEEVANNPEVIQAYLGRGIKKGGADS
ncbi:ABC transporter ATP-binding protein [Paradesulfitobacterium aromaticivorans]